MKKENNATKNQLPKKKKFRIPYQNIIVGVAAFAYFFTLQTNQVLATDLNPPVKSHFEAFITESEMLNANMVSTINTLKMKVPNRVFHEWCNIRLFPPCAVPHRKYLRGRGCS